MLINIRVSDLVSYTNNSLPLALLFSMTLYYALSTEGGSHTLGVLDESQSRFKGTGSELNIDLSSSYKWDGVLVNSSHISSLGNVMYSSHSIWLIITGYILLVAMVGTIVISLGSGEKTTIGGLTTKGFKK
jgi:NADH-ubiquinone oxidoreductase chain 6